jgi:GNAT superfamily N-acetyltransferase
VPLTALRPKHAGRAAHLHARALSGDFLPSLGEGFLRVFYRQALEQGLAFGHAWNEAGQPVAIVLASRDTSALFRKVVRSAAVPLARAALPAVRKHPKLLLKVAETFLYPKRERTAGPQQVTAELLVIAVDEAWRGRKIGETLVHALDGSFCQSGVPVYKVTVLQANAGANRFYRRLDFAPAGEFKQYGKMWNLYVKELNSTNRREEDRP